MTLTRTPEPRPDDPYQEAIEYQSMDHEAVNRKFVQELLSGHVGPRVIDLGCGPAGIPIELCKQAKNIDILADLILHLSYLGRRSIFGVKLFYSPRRKDNLDVITVVFVNRFFSD